MQGTTEATDTALRTLIDRDLRDAGHGPLDDLVEQRRGIGRSWQRVRDEIVELTQREVSRQTLYTWYPEHREKP